MKFAHIADCHVGGWRDPKLKDLSTRAFVRAVDLCIEKNVDFIVIAGDLFNTSLPPIDSLKQVVLKLNELRENNIPVYIVPGSHDFSPSGKTMLDVLENAALFVNVARGREIDGKLRLDFTVDEKTGTKITGMLGKKGGLEKGYYENLLREELEKEEGYKIFLFHTALTELKPKDLEKIDSSPISLLPRNFNYYAGGHPHFVFSRKLPEYGTVSYPGPLFPNNFRELEKLKNGGFYIIEDDSVSFEPVNILNVHSIKIDCNNKMPEEIETEIFNEIKNKEFNNTIVTIRVEGTLKEGKPSDINFKEIFQKLYDKSAYFVMKNTNKLTTREFEEIKIKASSVEDIESGIIRENLGQIKIKTENEEALIKSLMEILGKERLEGERIADFEKRVKDDVSRILDLGL